MGKEYGVKINGVYSGGVQTIRRTTYKCKCSELIYEIYRGYDKCAMNVKIENKITRPDYRASTKI